MPALRVIPGAIPLPRQLRYYPAGVLATALDTDGRMDQMATPSQGAFTCGQPVRILACPQNHPDHMGHVGTFAPTGKNTAAMRVYVGMGICQATAIEPVRKDSPQG